jgi:meiosis induction protein kinase IME2/SME1
MPILPSIRPVSPLSNAVTAQANSTISHIAESTTASKAENGRSATKKIGRQLSVNSNGNHYTDIHRQEAERALNGGGSVTSPPSGQKESFFSHLRKRARRLSGRNQTVVNDDLEANAGSVPWSNRSSMALDVVNVTELKSNADFAELDKALQNVRYSLDVSSPANMTTQTYSPMSNNKPSKRQSLPHMQSVRGAGNLVPIASSGPISSRTRRALQLSTHPVHRYETPEEEDELLDEVLHTATKAATRLGQGSLVTEESSREALLQKDLNYHSIRTIDTSGLIPNPYPTPSPSAKRNGVLFGQDPSTPSKPLRINKPRAERDDSARQWPTPPYEENHWASAATASIFAAGSAYR